MEDTAAPRQLSLLHHPDVPLQFRLDADTRRRGLRHIAEIRNQIAERQAARAMAEQATGAGQAQHRAPIRDRAA